MKLALIQMRVDGGEKEANLSRAESFIARAAVGGAQVVLLPEALNLGWTHRSATELADDIPGGESTERLRAAAQRHRVFVCAGLIERADSVRYNAAVFFGPDGRLLLHHRKLNELEIAHELYAEGDRLGVVETPLGKIGLMICSDGFAPGQSVSRTLALMGAQVILSPCAWAVAADHDNAREPYGKLWLDNYGAVARDPRLWIAGCSNVGTISDGPWKSRACIGCSLVVGPDGTAVLRGPYGTDAETVLHADIAIEPRPRRGLGRV